MKPYFKDYETFSIKIINSQISSAEIHPTFEIQRILKILFELCTELNCVMPDRAHFSKHFTFRCTSLEFIRRGI